MGKIVVMDSGFGGLTVLSELKKLMPDEEYIFYGDSANAPYGEKSHDELLKLTSDICAKLSSSYDIKCFVIACNTTSSEVWDELTDRFGSYDFVGIEPALKWAAEENPGSSILVLATTATTKGRRLRKRYEELKGSADITLLAAPGIVPYVEDNKRDKAAFHAYLEELLKDHIGKTDCVVLGCTHFPFVKDELREVLGPRVKFYDAAVLVAGEVKNIVSGDGVSGCSVPVHVHGAGGCIGHGQQSGTGEEIIFLNSDPSKVETEKELLDAYTVT